MRPLTNTLAGYLRSLLVREPDGEPADGDLLRRYVSSRDGDAFTALLHKHGPRVLSVARRVVGEDQTAEDVFQATFLLLARHGHALRRADAVGSWLSRTAFRLAVEARRSGFRRAEREAHVTPPATRSPLDELTAREVLTVLDEELARLPENYRWAVVLCCLEGLSHEEAARHVGCSPRALRARLERGRKRLGERLAARSLTLPVVLGSVLVAGAVRAVPPVLMETTLKAAAGSGPASTAAATLANEVVRTMMWNKLKAVGVGVAVIVAVSLGLAMFLPSGGPTPAQPPGPKGDAQVAGPKVDLHGDPLPDGAVMRLGTVKQRAVDARLAFSADGKSIVGVRGGKYVSVWDAATGKLKDRRELDGDTPFRTWLSQDGRWLAGDRRPSDGKLSVWDVAAGKLAHAFPVKDATSIEPAFSPDGKVVAGVCFTREATTVRGWNLETGKEVFAFEVQNEQPSWDLFFSPDGKHLLASLGSEGFGGQSMRCWDVSTRELVWRKKEFFPRSLAFTADGLILAPPPRGVAAVVLNRDTGDEAQGPKLPQVLPSSKLTLTPDGRTLLVSNRRDNVAINVWDLAAGKERFRIGGPNDEVIVSPDGKRALTNDGLLRLWDLATGKPLWEDSSDLGHAGEVVSLSVSADGQRLASSSADGSARLWDLASGKPLQAWRNHPTSPLALNLLPAQMGATAVTLSRDGRWLVTGGSDSQIKVVDVDTGKIATTIDVRGLAPQDMRVFQLRVTPDGERVVGLFGSNLVYRLPGQPETRRTHHLLVWDRGTGKELAHHAVERTQPALCAVAADGRTALINGTVIDLATGVELRRMEGTEESSADLPCSLSGDGRLVVGGCSRVEKKDGTTVETPDGVRVWEAATGKTVAHLKMTERQGLVLFLPGDRFVATCDLEGVRVWDARTEQVVLTRPMPEKVISGSTRAASAGCLAVTPDGKRLITGMPDGTILVWELRLPEVKAEPLADKEPPALWEALRHDDAGKAWRAAWRLAEDADGALRLLREKLKPVTEAKAEVVAPLLADLDSEVFAKRMAAAKGLKDLGPTAEAALRNALDGKRSPEQRRQIEGLLERLASPGRALSAEELREVRAVAVLSRVGGLQARQLLEELAGGVRSAPLTREAATALAER